jgi:diguanylate cyclase (GGDEF)-like protein
MYDTLTQILDKEEFINQAQEILHDSADNLVAGESAQCLLAAVDLDEFGKINRNNGLLFGDLVLCTIAGKLKRFLSDGDLLGRLGGDEFILLLRNISSPEQAEERLSALARLLENPFGAVQESMRFSFCAGAALFPAHGKSLEELFDNTAFSLMYSKHHGHGKGTLYKKSLRLTFMPAGVPGIFGRGREEAQNAFGSEIDPEVTKVFDENYIEKIFNILYNSPNVHEIIPVILSYIGNRFNVSRAYIVELSDDGNYYDRAFEWLADGYEHLGSIKRIPVREVDFEGYLYRDYFKNNNAFICNDVNELAPTIREILQAQGIKSLAQCALLTGGEFTGFVGYDDCAAESERSEEEIDSLMRVSRVLGIFYINARAAIRLKENQETITSLVNSMSDGVYVINPDNYELLIANRTAQEMYPSAKLGGKCYRAFRENDSVCEDCPVAESIIQGAAVSRELYDEFRDAWFACTASALKWRTHADACLISFKDITKSKKGL